MFTSFLLTRPTRTALLAARVGPRKSGCAVALASDLVRRKPHNFMPGDARCQGMRAGGTDVLQAKHRHISRSTYR